MKKKNAFYFMIAINTLFFSGISMAAVNTIQQAPTNQQTQQFDPSAPISMTKEQSDQVNQKLNEDKARSAKVKLENSKRDQVIMACGKLFDSSYSDESVKKVKSCLAGNNGMFPSDQQMANASPMDNIQSNSQQQSSTSPNSAPSSANNALGNSSSNQVGVENNVNNSQVKPQTQPKKQTMNEAMQNVLR